MSEALFHGSVSVFQNTKGRLVLKADADGKYSNANARDLLKKMLELAKQHNAEPVIFYGKGRTSGNPKTDRVEIRPSRWKGGDPYLAMLPADSQVTKPVKLA